MQSFNFMIKQILKFTSHLFFTVLLASSNFLTGINSVQAAQMSSNSIEDNPAGIVNEDSGDDINGPNISTELDLGDDQTFPFIPGFGKNSGKD